MDLRSQLCRRCFAKTFSNTFIKRIWRRRFNEWLGCAGAIIHYLKDTEHPNLQHITSLQRIDRDDFLWMDRFTIRNLELVYGNSEGNHTLLSVLDNTVSPMGARLLKRWIIFPLKDIHQDQ